MLLNLTHELCFVTDTSEEVLLRQALDMSGETGATETPSTRQTSSTAMPDFSMMSEEDQIVYAMQLSMAQSSAAG